MVAIKGKNLKQVFGWRASGLLALFWTVVVMVLFLANVRERTQTIEELARAEARGTFNKDVVYRRWAASHGGVYVPVTPVTPPNPYLDNVAERDITTESGRALTLINPAYMTRQVYEIGGEQYGLLGHITSLNPLRPENGPDPWEEVALGYFEVGAEEYSEVVSMEGKTYLRLMRPLMTEERCLKCHEHQGYEVGQIRGGISISVPMADYTALARKERTNAAGGFTTLWLLGLSGLGLATVLLQRRVKDRLSAEAALAQSEVRFQDLFDSAPAPYLTVDAEGRLTEANRAAENFSGFTSKELKTKKLVDLVPDTATTEVNDILNRSSEGLTVLNQELTFVGEDDSERHGLVTESS